MIKILRQNKAFTLIELLVYISIASIVLTIVLSFTISIVEGASQVSMDQEVFHNNRFVMNRIRYDIESSNSINVESSVFDNNNGVLVLNDDGNTIRYQLTGGKITRQVNAGPAVNLMTSLVTVSRLVFTNTTQPGGTPGVNILIDISSINIDNRPELDSTQTIETNVLLRDI